MGFRRNIKIIVTFPWMKWLQYVRRNRIGTGSWVATSTIINCSEIGHYVYIGANCVINNTKIGAYSSIAPGCQIGGMEHDYRGLSTCCHLIDNQMHGILVDIGEDVWIGANCIIKQGVSIGRGAVIGANSLVTHDVQPYSVVYGSPARFIKYRFDDYVKNLLDKSHYWEHYPTKAKEILQKISCIIAQR